VLTVKVQGLKEDTNTLKVRLLAGNVAMIDVSPDAEVTVENGESVEYAIAVKDQAGNPTSNPKLSIKVDT